MKERPNILLITTDQQRWDAVGFNNPQVKTPNLDALAAKGIVFENTEPTSTALNSQTTTPPFRKSCPKTDTSRA